MLIDTNHTIIGGSVPSLPDPGDPRLGTLISLSHVGQAESGGRIETDQALQQDVINTAAAVSGYIERGEGKVLDPRELKRLEQAAARAKAAQRTWRSLGGSAVDVNLIVPIANEAIRWARQSGQTAVPFTTWTDTIMGWLKRHDIGKALDGLGELQRQRQDVQQAHPPKPHAREQLIGKLDRMAETGKPRIDVRLVDLLDGRSVRSNIVTEARMSWPRVDLNAQPQHGHEPVQVADTLALLAWLHRDRFVAEIDASLDAAYANYDGPLLTPTERRAELNRIDHEIFAAEQGVSRIAWSLIDGGDVSAVRFLVGLNGGAVLGLHAPKGRG